MIQAPAPNRSRTMSGSYYFKTNKVLLSNYFNSRVAGANNEYVASSASRKLENPLCVLFVKLTLSRLGRVTKASEEKSIWGDIEPRFGGGGGGVNKEVLFLFLIVRHVIQILPFLG